MARWILALVGLAYIALAVWCVIRPTDTSRSVGFELLPGSGQSEYLVVYGGLQFALGLLFLQPMWRPATTDTMLEACVVIHGILVLFRCYSFMTISGIQPTTYVLSGVEWVLFLGSAAVWWTTRK